MRKDYYLTDQFSAEMAGTYVPVFFGAAATLYALFHGIIAQYDVSKGIVRGLPGSELSGMIYGEYFPNPSLVLAKASPPPISVPRALFAEAIGTAFLAFFVFAVTDEQNPGRPSVRT